MNELECRQIEPFLAEYLEEELEEPTRDAVKRHLDRCSTCQQELHREARLWSKVRAAAPTAAVLPSRQELERRLHATRRRKPGWLPVLATASAILVLFWFGWNRLAPAPMSTPSISPSLVAGLPSARRPVVRQAPPTRIAARPKSVMATRKRPHPAYARVKVMAANHRAAPVHKRAPIQVAAAPAQVNMQAISSHFEVQSAARAAKVPITDTLIERASPSAAIRPAQSNLVPLIHDVIQSGATITTIRTAYAADRQGNVTHIEVKCNTRIASMGNSAIPTGD